jgi:hypothetical protein
MRTLEAKLLSTKLDFDKNQITDSETVPELQTACILAIEARKTVENLVIGKLSVLRKIIEQEPMKILRDLGPSSKNYQTMQVLKMMGTDSDPLVVVDEAGSMAAIKIGENGELEIAQKPTWVDSITLFRDSRTLAHGNDEKNGRIDRQTYRRKYRFEMQAKRAEENFTKGEHFRNKQRKME